MKRILILGAGAAGLTLGNQLKKKGVSSFKILEKESVAGGLGRSVMVDGLPFDIGGPHYLDDRNSVVMDYYFQFLPKSEWTLFDRNSKLLMPDGQLIGSPIESYIWQLKKEDQVDYLESISQAGCNTGEPMPERFVDWVYWKLGKKIAENYMLPYNSKLYGDNLDVMGTYWLYKLPNVSFRETIMSCLDKQFYGQQPCQTRFYYPLRHGSGEVYLRMAQNIEGHIQYNTAVEKIDMETKTVTTADGEKFSADIIVTTVPWKSFKKIDGMPRELADKISQLKSTTLEVRYVNEEMDTDAQWIYCAGLQLPFHRTTIRRNVNPAAHGMVVEARKERLGLYGDTYPALFSYENEYAYPVNTIGKPEIMDELMAYAHGKDIYPIGRWGDHQHHNADVVVELVMKFADELAV